MMTSWPNSDQYSPVLATVRPVTHMAEVAVKSASIPCGFDPLFVENGSSSRKVPVRIKSRKPRRTVCAGLNLLFILTSDFKPHDYTDFHKINLLLDS